MCIVTPGPGSGEWANRAALCGRGRIDCLIRKLASIDADIAFVGGINLIDDIETPQPALARYDYAVRIGGPLAGRVRAAAVRLWTRVSWATLGHRWPGFALLRGEARQAPAQPPESHVAAGGQRAALVVRDGLRHRHDIEDGYLETINAARTEVILANAYFFPSRKFRRALLAAARRGVAVRLLLQGKSGHPLQHHAARALYRSLLGAGIRIHEYYLSELHAKVAVVDGRVATVGSSNVDPFSLALAREANVFVDNLEFSAELRASLHETIENRARAVPRNYWARLSFALKTRIWLSYRITRLLMAIYGVNDLR